MSFTAALSTLSSLNLAELQALRLRVDQQIACYSGPPSSAALAPARYRPGQKVTFWSRGRQVVMTINQVNPKTLGGIEQLSDGTTMRWRASPSLVKPYVESAAPPVLSPIVELPDAAAPPAHKPTTAVDTW
jgi:hypothetical protein